MSGKCGGIVANGKKNCEGIHKCICYDPRAVLQGPWCWGCMNTRQAAGETDHRMVAGSTHGLSVLCSCGCHGLPVRDVGDESKTRM